MKRPQKKRAAPSGPPTDPLEVAKVGIAAALPDAKKNLMETLRQLSADKDSVEIWLPQVKVFATALFNGGADHCCRAGLFSEQPQFEHFLQRELLPWVIEDIMPDRALESVIGGYKRPKGYTVTSTGPTDLPVARGKAGGRQGPEGQRYAVACDSAHGLLETCLFEAGLRRRLLPEELREVRKALKAHLMRLSFSLVGRFIAVPLTIKGYSAKANRGKGGRKPGTKVDGEKLKALRGGMDQDALSATCDVSLSTIVRGEAEGRWSEKMFEKVAKNLSTALNQKITPEKLKKKPHPPR